MKQALINVLEQFCPNNVYLQGTLNSQNPYPENFVTFWTNYTEDNSHFDDETYSVDWNFSVMFYSSNPVFVNTKPNEIRAALKAAGFIPQGKGNDIPSDKPSHTGWAMDFIKTEIL